MMSNQMSSDSPSLLVSGDVTGEGTGTRISADEGAGNGLSADEDLRSWTDAGRFGLEPNSEVANASGDDNSEFCNLFGTRHDSDLEELVAESVEGL